MSCMNRYFNPGPPECCTHVTATVSDKLSEFLNNSFIIPSKANSVSTVQSFYSVMSRSLYTEFGIYFAFSKKN